MKFNVDDLIEQGLVKKKTYTEGVYKGLSVLKYARKVFFNNLWNIDSKLLECRGLVIDEDDNIVVRLFKKVFNYLENNTKVDRDLVVEAPRKVNGFLAAATQTEKYGLIISTTGTLDSDYATIARNHIECVNPTFVEGCTYLFEICDESDPHIVEEECGAYLIGMRDIETGTLLCESTCNTYADTLGYKRPSVKLGRFSDILKDSKECVHEGYMIRDGNTTEVLCKLKSNHYLTKKALQRISVKNIDFMYNNTEDFIKSRVKDEEFFDLVNFVVQTVDIDKWKFYNEQQRRKFIEDYFNEH